MVAKSAFLDKGVVVEMDVVAGGSWEGMAVCGWNSGKGQPLGGIGIAGKSNGKRDRWRREANSAILEVAVTKRIGQFIERHAGMGLDVLKIHVELRLDHPAEGT